MRTPRKHIGLRLFFVAVSILVLSAGLLIWRAHRAMAAAHQYVSDVSRLQVGRSGYGDLGKIREKYAAYAEIGQPCNAESCIAKFRFSNGLPMRIYRDRPAFLYSVLTLSHGLITGVDIGAVCYGSGMAPALAQTRESVPNLEFTAPYKEDRNMSSDKVAHITFDLTPAASAEQRARAYAFDERFLGRFGACNDATDMH